LALQTPLWQTAAPVVLSQGPLPSTWPHMPLAPHSPFVHSPVLVQTVPAGPAHVLVVALHIPLAHTAAAFPGKQPSSCRLSFGMAAPFARRGTQVSVAGAQKVAPAQSLSTAHRPAPAGTQRWPLALHSPLLQRAAVSVVHPDWPSARPHSSSVPQAPIAQSPSP
jgi:hypothetical protein